MSKIPTMAPLKSSVLAGHHYDPATSVLHLQFTNGDTWRYRDVPMERAETLAGNASPGKYFTDSIKGQYAGEKVA